MIVTTSRLVSPSGTMCGTTFCVLWVCFWPSSVDTISVTILPLVGAHFTNTWCCKGRQRRQLICACACAAAPLDRRRRRVAFWPRKRRRTAVGRSLCRSEGRIALGARHYSGSDTGCRKGQEKACITACYFCNIIAPGKFYKRLYPKIYTKCQSHLKLISHL